MGCYNTCIYFGMMASSAGMGAVIRSAGFRTAFLLTGAISALILVIFFFLYRRPAVTRPG
jgi:predicted MFS family arabinose efflux permease